MYNLSIPLSVSPFLGCCREAPADTLHAPAVSPQLANMCWSPTEDQSSSQNLHSPLTALPVLPVGHVGATFSTDPPAPEGTESTARFHSPWPREPSPGACRKLVVQEMVQVPFWRCCSACSPHFLLLFSCPPHSGYSLTQLLFLKGQKRGWGTAERTPGDRLPANCHWEL